jgi:hypothetical protein
MTVGYLFNLPLLLLLQRPSFASEMLCFIHCKKKLEGFLHLSIFIKGRYFLSKGKIVPCDHCMIFLRPFCLWKGFNFADWQCSYVCYLCMSERSALTWICGCYRLETEVLTWSDFGWAGNLLLYVESATRSKLAVLKEKLSVLEQQLE